MTETDFSKVKDIGHRSFGQYPSSVERLRKKHKKDSAWSKMDLINEFKGHYLPVGLTRRTKTVGAPGRLFEEIVVKDESKEYPELAINLISELEDLNLLDSVQVQMINGDENKKTREEVSSVLKHYINELNSDEAVEGSNRISNKSDQILHDLRALKTALKQKQENRK